MSKQCVCEGGVKFGIGSRYACISCGTPTCGVCVRWNYCKACYEKHTSPGGIHEELANRAVPAPMRAPERCEDATCDCGEGKLVKLANGAVTCSTTVNRFRALYGYYPKLADEKGACK